jgi:hypothetical protein
VLDWIAERLLAAVNSVPVLFGVDAHHATLIRAVAALLLIVLVVYLIAMRPFRSFISRSKDRRQDTRSVK